MCMSAIIWANIKTVYYCNDVKAAEEIGFRDDYIYEYIKGGCTDGNVLHMYHLPMPEGQALYDSYKENSREMY